MTIAKSWKAKHYKLYGSNAPSAPGFYAFWSADLCYFCPHLHTTLFLPQTWQNNFFLACHHRRLDLWNVWNTHTHPHTPTPHHTHKWIKWTIVTFSFLLFKFSFSPPLSFLLSSSFSNYTNVTISSISLVISLLLLLLFIPLLSPAFPIRWPSSCSSVFFFVPYSH